ncbi:MAG TPA: PKD domain-containing protein [Blastocatellia bacterium]|nr:PKD domain-containing protein [Blastocatellia bacterium]
MRHRSIAVFVRALIARLAPITLLASITFFGAFPAGSKPLQFRDPETARILRAGGFEAHESEADSIIERIRLYLRRHGDKGAINAERRLDEARSEYNRRLAERSRPFAPEAVQGTNWVSLGPINGAGRATAIALDPTAQGTVYIGAADGGVWKSTDDGNTWIALTDAINDLSVGALAVAPASPNIIYLGTGEGGYAGDFIPGIGFLKSTDSGATWILPSSVIATKFYRILVSPANPNELIIGTDRGGFRSTDGGANWTPVIDTSVYKDVSDIVRDPGNPSTLYATTWDALSWCAGTGSCHFESPRVLKSTNGGISWVEKSNGLPSSTPSRRVDRMSIAISQSNPNVLYVGAGIDAGSFGSEVSHVFKSTDAGETWTDLPGVGSSSDGVVHGYLGGQSWYDNTIIVSPSDENVVLAGGQSYIRTTDGGVTWSVAPFEFSASGPHADAHDLRYEGTELFIANDGGIWTSPDDGLSSQPRNSGLVTRQYYALAIDPAHPNRIITGSQDNGTDFRPDAGGLYWVNVLGGDGIGTAINSTVPSIAFATVQFGRIFRTKQAGTLPPDFTEVTPPYQFGESTPFFSIVRIDPSNPGTLYTVSYRVWRSPNGGDNWMPLPVTTTDSSVWPSNTNITAMATSATGGQTILVAKAAAPLTAFRSTDGGTTWASAANSLPQFQSVNNLEIDPRDPLVAYAALAGTTGPNVFKSTDGGASWSASASGLPAFAAQVVRVDPTDSTTVYCGTDVGVYRSTDRGANWSRFGNGLPDSSVQDLQVAPDGSILRVATHGRGIWELQIPDSGSTPPVASITNPTSGITIQKGTALQFTGSVTSPNQSDSVTASWTFSDTWETLTTQAGTPTASHVFNRSGLFPVSLNARTSDGAVGSATVIVRVLEPAADCSTPALVPGSGPFPYIISVSNETVGFSGNPPFPACVGSGEGRSNGIWFEFTPTISGKYEFTTCGSALDAVLSVWTGPACGPYTQVDGGCDHVASPGSLCYQSRTADVVVQAAAGQTLRLLAAGDTPGDVGALTITVDAVVPRITGAAIVGKDLVVMGVHFSPHAVIEVNGMDQPTRQAGAAPGPGLIAKKAGKRIPRGTTVNLQVRNSDGTLSSVFSFRR